MSRDARAALSPGGQVGIDPALVRRVVETFYDKVRRDDLLGPIFGKAVHDWPSHLDRLVDFWSSLTLLTGAYKGHPMRAHFGLGDIGDAHFHRWLDLFETTLAEVCTPQQGALFLDRAQRIADSFRYGLAMQRGEMAAPLERRKA